MMRSITDLYPKTAKAVLAMIAVSFAGGPAAMRSADPKTRSHYTAQANRPNPIELSEEAMAARAMRLRVEEEEAQRQRLEREERRLQEKLEAQMRAERRRQERSLRKQIAEEEARAKVDIARRLQDREAQLRQELAERVAAEKRSRETQLETSMSQARDTEEEAMQQRLTEWEQAARASSDVALEREESLLREALETGIRKDEDRIISEMAKEIAREERSARRDLKKQVRDRERLAEAELEDTLALEAASKIVELDNLRNQESSNLRREMGREIAAADENALQELESGISERLEGSSAFPHPVPVDSVRMALSSIRTTGRSLDPIADGALTSDSSGWDAKRRSRGSKRPSILGSFYYAPRKLMASIGNAAFGKAPSYSGYLAYQTPPPLRFSDSDSLTKRAPSAALPEFAFVAPGTRAMVVASEFGEEAARRAEMRNQIVVELDPHTIVSGRIDWSIPKDSGEREGASGEFVDEPVVRPEEVLIFFENERESGDVRTIVPFSPALPSNAPPVRSGATYNRVE